jgi:hypothetical protein
MTMSNDQIYSRSTAQSRGPFRGAQARGPIIDQEGREIPAETLHPQFNGFRFDFGTPGVMSPSSCRAPISATASTASSG